MSVEEPPVQARHSLIDSAIVILISVGVTIFLFWLGSTFAGAAYLSQLPEFIKDPFKAVWSSVLTGGAGVGLAITRTLTDRGRPTPDYLKQIAVGTSLMLMVVVGISLLARPSGPVLQLSKDLNFIDPEEPPKAPQNFTLEGKPAFGPPGAYVIEGTYELKQGQLLVHMLGGHFTLAKQYRMKPDMKLTHISLSLCYVVRTSYGENWDSYPPISAVKSGRLVNIPLIDDTPVALPPLELTISNIPAGLPRKKTWLCGQIWTDLGGFTPVE